MEFRILGPVRALEEGRPIPLGGHRQRALLAVLLVHANEPLSADRLADELWGEAASAQAAKRLQVSIHRLRRALDGGRNDGNSHSLLVTDAGGYVLRLEPGALDRDRFEDLVQAGRRAFAHGDPGRASQVLGEALNLWRGPPLADVAYESFAQPEIARLQELHISATEAQIDARLALGADSELVPELEAVIASHPLRERLRAQLMLALYRSGRQADALEVYRRAREMLHDELGLEPGVELRRLEQAILRHDPTIALPSSAPRGRVTAPDPGRRKAWGIVAGVAALAAATVAVLLTGAMSSHPSPVPPNVLAEIEPLSDRVVGAVVVGARPGPIAIGDGALWVGNLDDDSVSRVDPRSSTVLRTIAVADSPAGLAAGPGGVWVAASDNAVREIDPAFDSVTEIRQPSTGYLRSASLPSPVASGLGSVWIAGRTAVVRFAPRGGRPSASVGVGLSPDAVAVGFGSVWIADSAENTVTRIDPATNLPTTIGVGDGPAAIAAGAGAVWLADALDNSVVRIDPIRRVPVATIRVGRSPTGIAVGAGGVWVANSGSGTVSRIDPVSNRVVATIEVGHSPSDIAVEGGRVWTSVQGDAAASVVPALGTAGGVARVDLQSDADLRSLDPALAASPDAWQIEYATCTKLLDYPDLPGAAGEHLVPSAARALPRLSGGGKTYAFTLRNGLRFSPPSGALVTAETFRSTILRTLNPRMQSPADAFMGDIVGARAYIAGRASDISGLSAHGDTLTVRLEQPAPDLPARLASPYFCAVPRDTPVDPGGVRGIPSAGPYYVAAYTPGSRIVLARNPYYPGPRPRRVAQFIYTLGIDPERSVQRVQSRNTDYIVISQIGGSIDHVTDAQLTARYGSGSPAARAGHQQYFVNPTQTGTEIWLNASRPLFADARLRRALNYALDRRALIQEEESSGPRFYPSDQYLPPGLPGYRRLDVYPLGAPDLTTAHRIAGPGLHGTAVLYTGIYPPAQDRILTRALNAIGIRVVIRRFSLEELFARERRRNEPFDLVAGGYQIDYGDPFDVVNLALDGRYIGGPDASNMSHFNDPTYNRELRAAARLGGSARYRAYARLDERFTRDAAPMAAWGILASQDFFSARVGCQTYQPLYGMDLGALCLR